MHCLSTVAVMSFNWLLCSCQCYTRYQACLHYPDDVMEVLSLLLVSCSVVLALEYIYETSHEPEALVLSKVLSSHSTIAVMHLLNYILPQVAKLSQPHRPSTWTSPLFLVKWMLLLIHLMMLYCLQQIGFYNYKMQEKS